MLVLDTPIAGFPTAFLKHIATYQETDNKISKAFQNFKCVAYNLEDKEKKSNKASPV